MFAVELKEICLKEIVHSYLWIHSKDFLNFTQRGQEIHQNDMVFPKKSDSGQGHFGPRNEIQS